MPKTTGTKIEALRNMFAEKKVLTVAEIKEAFPRANPSTMVWHLKYKKGLVIETMKEGRKTLGFRYNACLTGITIDGSKKAFDARMKETESR